MRKIMGAKPALPLKFPHFFFISSISLFFPFTAVSVGQLAPDPGSNYWQEQWFSARKAGDLLTTAAGVCYLTEVSPFNIQ